MSKITAIRSGKGRRKRVRLYLDGKPALSLDGEMAVNEGLKVGQELSGEQIEALTRVDLSQRCLNAAIHFLSYRPRSEHEVRQRLHRRGFDSTNIENTVAKLKEQGLIDDQAFARFWKDNRDSFSPRGKYLIRLELKQKGVSGDIIGGMDATDDSTNAYRAAVEKARRLSRSDYQSFRRKLGEYLRRRGFGYELINRTIEQIWQGNAPD